MLDSTPQKSEKARLSITSATLSQRIFIILPVILGFLTESISPIMLKISLYKYKSRRGINGMMTIGKLREQLRMGRSIYDLSLRVTYYARVSTEKVE